MKTFQDFRESAIGIAALAAGAMAAPVVGYKIAKGIGDLKDRAKDALHDRDEKKRKAYAAKTGNYGDRKLHLK